MSDLGLSTDAKRALAIWFGSGDNGASSMTLLISALTGFAPEHAAYPHDPADFGRCARLIERVPEVKTAAFPVLSSAGKVWPSIIAAWDEIHACMDGECGIAWEKARSAPKTYRLMNSIIYSSPRK
jgi:hypothetical protein